MRFKIEILSNKNIFVNLCWFFYLKRYKNKFIKIQMMTTCLLTSPVPPSRRAVRGFDLSSVWSVSHSSIIFMMPVKYVKYKMWLYFVPKLAHKTCYVLHCSFLHTLPSYFWWYVSRMKELTLSWFQRNFVTLSKQQFSLIWAASLVITLCTVCDVWSQLGPRK